MGSRRRRQPGGEPPPDLLLVDAGMIAGWRRAVPSLDQADEITESLRRTGRFEVVVLADAGLKHDLAGAEKDRFERYRSNGDVICAAAGTKGGHTGFMAAVANRAALDAERAGRGRRVLVLTARDLGQGDWRLARLSRHDDGWRVSALPNRAA